MSSSSGHSSVESSVSPEPVPRNVRMGLHKRMFDEVQKEIGKLIMPDLVQLSQLATPANSQEQITAQVSGLVENVASTAAAICHRILDNRVNDLNNEVQELKDENAGLVEAQANAMAMDPNNELSIAHESLKVQYDSLLLMVQNQAFTRSHRRGNNGRPIGPLESAPLPFYYPPMLRRLPYTYQVRYLCCGFLLRTRSDRSQPVRKEFYRMVFENIVLNDRDRDRWLANEDTIAEFHYNAALKMTRDISKRKNKILHNVRKKCYEYIGNRFTNKKWLGRNWPKNTDYFPIHTATGREEQSEFIDYLCEKSTLVDIWGPALVYFNDLTYNEWELPIFDCLRDVVIAVSTLMVKHVIRDALAFTKSQGVDMPKNILDFWAKPCNNVTTRTAPVFELPAYIAPDCPFSESALILPALYADDVVAEDASMEAIMEFMDPRIPRGFAEYGAN